MDPGEPGRLVGEGDVLAEPPLPTCPLPGVVTALVAAGSKGAVMPVVMSLILFGVLLAAAGLVIEGLAWAMVAGLAVLATGVFIGASGRSRGRARA